MSEGTHYNVNILAHELRHIHQQQLLTVSSLEFYSRYIGQDVTSGSLFYQNSVMNDTFEPYYGYERPAQ